MQILSVLTIFFAVCILTITTDKSGIGHGRGVRRPPPPPPDFVGLPFMRRLREKISVGLATIQQIMKEAV
jgi:hypothetical protein